MPRRADGEVLDAVAVEIAGGDDHAAEQLAGLRVPTSAAAPSRWRRSRRGPRPGASRVWSSVRGRGDTATSPLPSPSRSRDRRDDPAEAAAAIASLPVRAAPCRSPTRGPRRAPTRRAGGVRRGRRADGEVGAAVAVEIVEPGDVPAEGRALLGRRVGAQHRAVLAAHEIDPRRSSRDGRADEEVGAAVAVLVAGEREVPAEVLALGLRAPPDAPRRSWASAPRRCRARARRRGAMRRGDDHVREPVAGEVGHGITQWPKSPSGQLAVPRRGSARRSRPTRRWRCRSAASPARA